MKKIHIIKHFGVLCPASEDAEELIKALPAEKIMALHYSFPRNYKYHQKFFVFISTTFDMQDFFDNKRHYRKWIVLKAGYYTIINTPGGGQIFDTDSIAFDKMDDADFRKCFNACIDVFIGRWGDKITREELEQIVGFS